MRRGILISIIICVVSTGMYGAALQAGPGKAEEAESFHKKCLESLRSGDAVKAVEYGEQAIALRDGVSAYYMSLGDAYKLKRRGLREEESFGIMKKALQFYEKAVQLDGKNKEARLRLANYYLEVPIFVGGSIEKAKKEAVQIETLNALDGHVLFAAIYLKEKDLEKGEQRVNLAYDLHMAYIKAHPGEASGLNRDILNNYGYYYISERQFDKAIDYFQKNVNAFPGHFNGYDSLAEAHMKKGNTEQAIKYYEKALELNPQKSRFERWAYKAASRQLEQLKKLRDTEK